MKLLKKFRDWLIMLKIYFGRSQSYLSIANTSMILIVLLTTLKDKGYVNFDITAYFIPLVALGMVLLILLGYFELKFFRGLNKEQEYYAQMNPFMVEIKDKIDSIETKLVNLENENKKNL